MHANFHVTLAFALLILKSSMNNYQDDLLSREDRFGKILPDDVSAVP